MGGRRLFVVCPLWAFWSEVEVGHEGRSYGGTPDSGEFGARGTGAHWVNTVAFLPDGKQLTPSMLAPSHPTFHVSTPEDKL